MRGSKQDIPVFSQFQGAVNRQIEWGGMNVSIETDLSGFDPAPLFHGMPGNCCHCPHWGYVVKGKLRVKYPDYEEVIQAGDVYYLVPGHLASIEEAGEIVEFSPAREYQQTLEATVQNMARLMHNKGD